MPVNIACNLRSIVAILSVGNLKEYLREAVAVLPSENSLKPIIVQKILDKEDLQKADLKTIYQELKNLVKKYDPSNREPFQKTILEPIRAFFSPGFFDPTEMRKMIQQQKEILQKSEKELSEAQKLIKKDKAIPFPKVLANR
jgi:hypothetical protein